MYCPKCGDIVENGEFFCNKCGNDLRSEFRPNVAPPTQNKKPKNKTMIFMGSVIGVFVLLIVFVGIFVVKNANKNFYISNDTYNDETILSNNTDTKVERKSKYTTIYIDDNMYEGVKIRSEQDAENLIIKDSVSQKNNCPKEIEEIENQMISKYNISAVNLCELDLNFAKEMLKVFEFIYSEYPNIKEHLTNFSVVNASLSDGYIAVFMGMNSFASDYDNGVEVFRTKIMLNTKYFFNLEKLQISIDNATSEGHFPPNTTIYSPIAHEFGHYISFLSAMKKYNIDSVMLFNSDNGAQINSLIKDWIKGEHSLEMITEAYNNYKGETNTTLTLDEWRGTISDYALAKDNNGEYIYDETIAEAFHDVYLNGENAKDASKYIVEVLKKRVGVSS